MKSKWFIQDTTPPSCSTVIFVMVMMMRSSGVIALLSLFPAVSSREAAAATEQSVDSPIVSIGNDSEGGVEQSKLPPYMMEAPEDQVGGCRL